MKKGINKGLLLIILGILLIGSGFGYHFVFNNKTTNNEKEENKPVGKEKITPLMYEVTKEGSDNKIYLFGSIHAANLDKTELPEYLENAYNNSSYIAFEIDVTKEDFAETMREQELIVYPGDDSLKNHLNPEIYKSLEKFIKEKTNYSMELVDRYVPFGVTQLLTQKVIEDTGIDVNNGVEMTFTKRAKKDKKTILEVESEKFQFDLLASFPNRNYEIEIKETVENYEDAIKELKNLYELWKKGNYKDITDYVTKEDYSGYTESDIELLKNYNKALVDDRNIGMTDKFEEYFNNNYNTLFIVGTAHLVGDNGIVSLLTNRGYNVVQINK